MSTAVPSSDTTPLSPQLVEMAQRAVKDFHECFWFRHPDADITEREDIELIIDRLRRYGRHRAWQVSQQLRLCL